MKADIKQQLLESAGSSQYLDLSPAQLNKLYLESSSFLGKNASKLESAEYYELFAHHFHLALLTCHDNIAKLILQRISDRFGADSSRVSLLRSFYIESCDGGPAAAIEFLNTRPETDFNAMKRRIALFKPADTERYVEELLNFLTICPLDAEVWAELASVYISLGKLPEAIHALQEVVIACPRAYNNYALLADAYFQSALMYEGSNTSSARENYSKNLELSLKHYARAVELCPNYLRGWSGILATASKLKNSQYSARARRQLELLIPQSASRESIEAAESVLKHYSLA